MVATGRLDALASSITEADAEGAKIAKQEDLFLHSAVGINPCWQLLGKPQMRETTL